MPGFEYKEFKVETSGLVSAKISNSFLTQLNDYGKDGWKLIQAVPFAQSYGRTSAVTFIMFREINS
jgi:hypothetical protein